MTTLKQFILVLATAVASARAGPLSVDSTATAIVGAPESAATEISKPLEGKELEDLLANGPYIPEGAIDVTNTTLALELIKFIDAHPGTNGLVKKSGACGQGDCPDFHAAFDFYSQHYLQVIEGKPIIYWAYWGRWNDCGQCGRTLTSKDGCFNFTSCGRKQSICVDSSKARAHRVWHDVGHKTCYNAARADYGNCGVGQTNSIIWYPSGETECTW
jgi:hypothetical protein